MKTVKKITRFFMFMITYSLSQLHIIKSVGMTNYFPMEQWMQNIRGYYDRGKFRLLTWNSAIGQFIRLVREQRDGVKGV